MKIKAGKLFWVVLLVIGYTFLTSGWAKINGGVFVDGLAKTLSAFAAKNPYPWFKDLLLTVAIPNTALIGPLVEFGELATGLTLVVGAIYIFFASKITLGFKGFMTLGSLIGASLNGVFYLAAGWTSPSTSGLNLLMMVAQLVAVAFIWQLPTQKKTLFR